MNSESKELSFEEALKELEAIVQKLEQEDVPLEKMMHYYEKGMALSKKCSEMLQTAEEKMAKILNDDGQIEPFHVQEES